MRRSLILFLLATAAHAQSLRDDVRAWRVKNEAAILDEFNAFLAIPNLASDTPNIERNAAALNAMLRRRGIESRLLQVEGAPPVVFGELKSPGATQTFAMYAHYDGQPVDGQPWESAPWTPVMKD